MDQVIEAVTDAICQLVLFSVEAEENNTMLVNIVPGAKGVQAAVGVLVDIALEMAKGFSSEPKIQNKMTERASEIRQATTDIVSFAERLAADEFDQGAKKRNLVFIQGTTTRNRARIAFG
jgi:hypothetical protein